MADSWYDGGEDSEVRLDEVYEAADENLELGFLVGAMKYPAVGMMDGDDGFQLN